MSPYDLIFFVTSITEMLISLYEKGQIDFETFTENINLKVQFLNDAVEYQGLNYKREIIVDLLERCNNITSAEGYVKSVHC